VYKILLTPEAFEDLYSFRKFEQTGVLRRIKAQLEHQPTVETLNRKRLRPNDLAEWELRIGRLRVFYDVDEEERIVKVEAIGCKEGSTLFIHGEEYEL
jgi:mRNA-degrading endonuclease RelE of RelBE toxin-antitoxin system